MLTEKLRETLIALTLVVVSDVTSQNWPDHRWDNWLFDIGYNVSFGSGQPTPGPFVFSNRVVHSVYSDPLSGVIMFKTDGHNIYDANGDPMPNGQNIASGVEFQSLILSADNWNHFVITLNHLSAFQAELRYSKVDLTLNGGLGDVTSEKGILLDPDIMGFTAFSSTSGDTTWLVTARRNSEQVIGFPITVDGIGQPYSAHDGTVVYSSSTLFCSKNSRNNDQVCFKVNDTTLRTFLTERTSGLLLNALDIVSAELVNAAEYSSTGNALYVERILGAGVVIDQHDLGSWDSTLVADSRTNIAINPFGVVGSANMQLAPDGTIICISSDPAAHPDSAFASRIHYPNSLGVGCTYTPDDLFVALNPVPDYGVTRVPRLWWPALAPDVSVLESEPLLNNLLLSPNPTNGLIQVTVQGTALPDRWELHDATGRVACEFGGIGSAMSCLDLSPVAAGVYTLCALSKGQRLASARVARQ